MKRRWRWIALGAGILIPVAAYAITQEETSKINTYVVLRRNYQAASKVNTYVVLRTATGLSRPRVIGD